MERFLPEYGKARRRLFVAALTGAVGFELLKLLLSGYMQGVATKSMYGAFGVPVALLLWINFTSKLVLFCAAWTATGSKEQELEDDDLKDQELKDPDRDDRELKDPDRNDQDRKKPQLKDEKSGDVPNRAAASGG